MRKILKPAFVNLLRQPLRRTLVLVLILFILKAKHEAQIAREALATTQTR